MKSARCSWSWAVGLLLGVFLLGAGRAPAQCVGDCSADNEVTVDEIIVMVNIALGTAEISACTAGDSGGDGEITVDEIVAAVNNSLNNCPVVGGPLGTRRFTINPRTSPFTAVLAPGFSVPLGGGFRGQKDGVVGDAYMDLRAGEPDENGFTTIDVTEASDYFFVDGRALAPLVLCLKPRVPVLGAGALQCNGGTDYSIGLSTDHHVGQIGIDGFTSQDCMSQCSTLGICGSIEGPNHVCAAGLVGDECVSNSDCETTRGAGDGVCGLGRLCLGGRRGASCTANADCNSSPESSDGVCSPAPTCTDGKRGEPCRADADCDSTPTALDGQCGNRDAHPGVCNGPQETIQVGGDSGAGSVILAPVFGLQGLPMELSIESAPPCGDEGRGFVQPFAMTTGISRAVIRNFSNSARTCSDGSECTVDADCDTADGGPGLGVCGTTLVYDSQGENFSCSQWRNASGPGCFALAVPAVDFNPMGGDLVTAFKFCGR